MSKLELLTDLDIENIATGQVHNSKDINLKSNRPYKGGLYDPVVFGALKECECGRTKVIGRMCNSCRNIVMSSEQYAASIGYYKLYSPYVLYIAVPSLISKLNDVIDLSGYGKVKTIQDLWSLFFNFTPLKNESEIGEDTTNIFRSSEGDIYKVEVSDLPDESKVDTSVSGEYSMTDAGLFGLLELSSLSTFKGVSLSWIKSFIHYDLVIPGIANRPVNKFIVNKSPVLSISPITKEYSLVIDHDKMLPNLIENSYDKLVDKMTLCCFHNVMVDKLSMSNAMLQPSKQSMGRTLIETRVSRSLRSNVVSNNDLLMNQISIPRTLAYKALQQDIIEAIKSEDIIYTDAIKMYNKQDPVAIEKFEYLVADSMVSMTRNPSLHRHSMQAFYPQLWDEIAIGVPTAVCEAYNMDFDGDTVAIQFYLDKLTKAEMQCITPDKMWFYDKRYQSQFNPKHETMYGLHVATKINESKELKVYENLEDMTRDFNLNIITLTETLMLGDKKTTYGRAYLSSVTGMDLDIVLGPEPLTLKNIGKLISPMGYHDNRVQEYKALEDFARLAATSVGLGALPYTDLYVGSEEEVKAILSQEGKDAIVLKTELKEYMRNKIQEQIQELPSSNMKDLMNSVNRVKLDTLVNMHAPYINVQEGVVEVSSDSLSMGLGERSYWEQAAHDRDTLAYKKEAVPASGFDQRQLINACLDLVYKNEENPSADNVGILLPVGVARGRTKLDGTKVTGGVTGTVRVRSCINNLSPIMYSDEIYFDKYSFATAKELRSEPCIGIAFASALTEQATQGGLGFKHGGDLESLDDNCVLAIESGVVKDITSKFLVIEGDHVYKYLLTKVSSIVSGIDIGSFITKDSTIIKSLKVVLADEQLSKFNTILDNVVMGDLGKLQDSVINYSIEDCSINYDTDKGIVKIGSLESNINENELYYYPDGYQVKKGTCIGSGVPDISTYLRIESDTGLVFYIFYHYCTTFIDMFNNFNSEPLEAVFKCIKNFGFSVQSTNAQKESLGDRFYYGAATNNLKKDLTNKLDTDADGRLSVSLGDSVIMALILGNKYK